MPAEPRGELQLIYRHVARTGAGRVARRTVKRLWEEPKRPHEIFSPSGPPNPMLYVERKQDQVQDKIRQAIEQHNTHLVVRGPSGVGKSSLVEHVITNLRLKTYWAETADSYTNSPVIPGLLKNLTSASLGWRERERSRKSRARTDGKGTFGPASFSVTQDDSEQIIHDRVDKTLAESAIEALASSNVDVFVIDDFEWLAEAPDSADVYQLIRRLLITLSGGRRRPLTLVIIGPERHLEPIFTDEKVHSRTLVIDVPHMNGPELVDILDRAQDDIRVTLTQAARETIVDISDGSAALTHRLGERACGMAQECGAEQVQGEHVIRAVRALLAEYSPLYSAARAYRRALEPPEATAAHRELLLHALCDCTPSGAHAQALDARYRAAREAQTLEPIELQRPLAELIEQGILERRVDDRIAFRLSAMRPYIRYRLRYNEIFDSMLGDEEPA